MRNLTRVVAVALIAGGLTACGDDPDCATSPPRPPVVRPTSGRMPKPVKPTIRQWRGDRPRNYKTAQPTKTVYRTTYPGYTGYYPPGIYPYGYGREHGCNVPEGAPIQ